MPIGGLGQGYQGDNIDITSTSSKLWPVWMDNSTGIYQIWTTPIDFSTVDVEDFNVIPSSFKLEQNYPNPFNNSTVIKYSIPQEGLVTLKAYNLLGEEVARLVNDIKKIGNYEVSFDATGLPSGVYFYRLQAGSPSAGSGQSFVETKKMVLMK